MDSIDFKDKYVLIPLLAVRVRQLYSGEPSEYKYKGDKFTDVAIKELGAGKLNTEALCSLLRFGEDFSKKEINKYKIDFS